MDKAKNAVTTSQVFLPYYNPAHQSPSTGKPVNMRGWQFGQPPYSNSNANMSVYIMGEDGGLYADKNPVVNNDGDSLPRPFYTHVPVETENGTELSSLVSPTRDVGSLPIEEMASMRRQRFYTPSGCEFYELQKEPCDLRVDILSHLNGEVDLQLGPHRLGVAEVKDGRLLSIEPTERAYDCSLWTSHLARVYEVIAREGTPLSA